MATHGQSEGRTFGFTRAFLEHAHEQRRLWRALIGKKGGVAVQQRFRQMLLELVREEVAALAAPQRADILDGIAHYIAGAFGELLFWWLDSRTALTPADVDEIFHRLTKPALAGLTGPGRPNFSRR